MARYELESRKSELPCKCRQRLGSGGTLAVAVWTSSGALLGVEDKVGLPDGSYWEYVQKIKIVNPPGWAFTITGSSEFCSLQGAPEGEEARNLFLTEQFEASNIAWSAEAVLEDALVEAPPQRLTIEVLVGLGDVVAASLRAGVAERQLAINGGESMVILLIACTESVISVGYVSLTFTGCEVVVSEPKLKVVDEGDEADYLTLGTDLYSDFVSPKRSQLTPKAYALEDSLQKLSETPAAQGVEIICEIIGATADVTDYFNRQRQPTNRYPYVGRHISVVLVGPSQSRFLTADFPPRVLHKVEEESQGQTDFATVDEAETVVREEVSPTDTQTLN